MRVLALDTTTRAGGVALVEDGRVVEERIGDGARTHAERLPGDILSMIAAHHVTLADIDRFAVAAGPGSFTGLRIGIATIQGLAFVNRRRIAAVSALEALAQTASQDVPPGAIVAAWMDAHRRDVFAAAYRVTPAPIFGPERLVELDGPFVGMPRDVLSHWDTVLPGAPAAFAGDGAGQFADIIRARLGEGPVIVAPASLAAAIGRMAVSSDAVEPSAVRPLYVRRPDAEIDREQRMTRQGERGGGGA